MAAMTNAEKQAAHRARKEEALASLAASLEAALKENAELRTKLDTATAKVHALELKLAKKEKAK